MSLQRNIASLVVVALLVMELEALRMLRPVGKPGQCPRGRSLHRPSRGALLTSSYGGSCISDIECPGTKKCCGSPKSCENPAPIVKPGSCPTAPAFDPVACHSILPAIGCSTDGDCSGRRKCCAIECGGKVCELVPTPSTIRPPTTPTPAPTTPTLPPISHRCPAVPPRYPPICARVTITDYCNSDNDCTGGKMCCRAFCGVKDCIRIPTTRPTLPTRPTIPVRPPTSPLCPVVARPHPPICDRIRVRNECNSDRDCHYGQLCCPGLCGSRRCIRINTLTTRPPRPTLPTRPTPPASTTVSPYHSSCPVLADPNPPICMHVRVGRECDSERDCSSGKSCCPGICGSSSCVALATPRPTLPTNPTPLASTTVSPYHSSCPVLADPNPPICIRVRVRRECDSVRDCSGGKLCCPGICGSSSCVALATPHPAPPATTTVSPYHSSCPVLADPNPPICIRVRVRRECDSERDCSSGKLCCPGICGSSSCVALATPHPAPPASTTVSPYHSSCPVLVNPNPPICIRARVRNECNVDRDCPNSGSCCPGICGANRCVALETSEPTVRPPRPSLPTAGPTVQSPRPSSFCPAVRQPLPAICAHSTFPVRCDSNRDCEIDEVCCPNLCGVRDCLKRQQPFVPRPTPPTVSIRPNLAVINPLCPITTVPDPLPRVCAVSSTFITSPCSADADCVGGEICCFDRCGTKQCQVAPRRY